MLVLGLCRVRITELSDARIAGCVMEFCLMQLLKSYCEGSCVILACLEVLASSKMLTASTLGVGCFVVVLLF